MFTGQGTVVPLPFVFLFLSHYTAIDAPNQDAAGRTRRLVKSLPRGYNEVLENASRTGGFLWTFSI